MAKMDFLIGADPEFFVKKGGKHVSAYGLVEGTKEKPFKVNKGAVQVDGMALEFNIDPAKNKAEFVNNISTVMTSLRSMVGGEYEFSFTPVAEFGKEYIDAQPDKAKELGCDPDFNAYTGEPNPAPAGDLGIRTASGHIHIGWTKDMDPHDPGHYEACRMLTKQLDATLLPLSLAWDNDSRRREMYGKPGAFRPKPYGLEYRVLSNVWLQNPMWIELVYHCAKTAADNLMSGTRYYESFNVDNVINKGRWASVQDYALSWNRFDNGDYNYVYSLFQEAAAKGERPEYLATKKPVKKEAGFRRGVVDVAVAGIGDNAWDRAIEALARPVPMPAPGPLRGAVPGDMMIFDEMNDEEEIFDEFPDDDDDIIEFDEDMNDGLEEPDQL